MEMLVNVKLGRARRAVENGREYLVAPMTLIVPGVLNGSMGALYYPADEVRKTYRAWNGMPLTLRHPTAGGRNVSARHPGVLDRLGMGEVRNATVTDSGKLKAEGWFEVGRVRKVAPDVYSALRAGRPVELSTGLFTDNQPAANGSACPLTGRPYAFVARNYRPDHVAILPDQTGACSLGDGCGVFNVANMKKKDRKGFTSSVGGDFEKGDRIEVDGKGPGTFKRWKTNGDAVVTLDSDGDEYSFFPGKVKAAGDAGTGGSCKPGQTALQTGCTPKTTNNRSRETTMDKTEAIEYLTANCACWQGEDGAEVLNEMDEDKVLAMAGREMTARANAELVANMGGRCGHKKTKDKAKPAPPPPAPPAPADDEDEDEDEETYTGNRMTTEQVVALLPESLRQLIGNAEVLNQAVREEKARAIAVIVGNAEGDRKARAVAALDKINDLGDLRAIAEVARPAANQAAAGAGNPLSVANRFVFGPRVPNYAGAGVGRVEAGHEPEELDQDSPLGPTSNSLKPADDDPIVKRLKAFAG